MARKRGKMALYEVMSKARARAEQSKTVEPLQPVKKPEPVKLVKPVPVVEKKVEVPEPKETVNWRKKPRFIQYNLGRIEFSIPYQLAITAGLGLLLLLLLAFRFGQFSSGNNQKPVVQPAENSAANSNSSRSGLPDLANPGNRSMTTPTNDGGNNPVVERENSRSLGDPDGTNVIVLAEHNSPTQLIPVKEYFDKNGIPTLIYQVGNKYQLWTDFKFKDNPANPGTKGNAVIERIKELGKKYVAPEGYDSFAPHYFSDAYGRKVEN